MSRSLVDLPLLCLALPREKLDSFLPLTNYPVLVYLEKSVISFCVKFHEVSPIGFILTIHPLSSGSLLASWGRLLTAGFTSVIMPEIGAYTDVIHFVDSKLPISSEQTINIDIRSYTGGYL